jgi:hypothetical protein
MAPDTEDSPELLLLFLFILVVPIMVYLVKLTP